MHSSPAPLEDEWRSHPTPRSPAQLNVCQSRRWNIMRQNRVVAGVKGWRRGGGCWGVVRAKTNAYLLCCTLGGPSGFKPIRRAGAQPRVLPPRGLAVLKGQRLACVRIRIRELLRAGAARSAGMSCWQPPACALARAPPPTGDRAPTPSVIWHHLLFLMHGHNQRGTKWFRESGRDSGHTRT